MGRVEYTLGELATLLEARLEGNPSTVVVGVKPLAKAGSSDIAFYADPKLKPALLTTQAAAVVLLEKDKSDCPTVALVVANPKLAFSRLTALFAYQPVVEAKVHPSVLLGIGCHVEKVSIGAYCILGNRVKIGKGTIIHPHCVIGDDTIIGEDCILYPKVTFYHGVTMGNQSILHSGCVIGSDGFGLARESHSWRKIAQIGGVEIGSHVEIGANSTIDRGTLENTVIHDGVKIDNLVQIAHNVIIGQDTAIAACVGISGSTRVGQRCMIGGATGIGGHLTITDDVTITGMSMITKSIFSSGMYSSGTGFFDNLTWRKNIARFRQLDQLVKRVNQLINRVIQLESRDNERNDD